MSAERPDHLPLAVLISGGGTTLRNLIEKSEAGELPIDFRLVISSNPQARGLQFAREHGIRSLVIPRRKADSAERFSQQIFDPCRQWGAGLVAMGGFLKHVLIPEDFAGRVMNIHPSLIPAFCGEGYYGLRVHQAVLDYGAKVSGCTVHFVNNQFDHGPIILQRVVPVEDDDTAETLARRVFEQECLAYPEAIGRFAQGRLELHDRRVRTRPA